MRSFELENECGLRLRGLDVGATLSSLSLPVGGMRRELLLGCSDADYPTQQVWLGAVAGRFANRIGGATLARDGQCWPLDANQPPHTLHGGAGGFHRQPWQIETLEASRVRLSLFSPDGDQGFPGNLRVALEYRLEERDLVVECWVSTDAPTPVSLTSHAYFNLDGGGDVRHHKLTLKADRFLATDASGLPLAPHAVEGPFDLRGGRLLGDEWLSHPQQRQAKGYDHAFLLNGPPSEWAALLVSGDGQLVMEVHTNQPSLQLYTGNWLAKTLGRDGQRYQDYDGLCLEAQQLPDSPNRPELGDPWLLPGQRYHHLTRYRFEPR
ncbi:galactose-1-epimerase [Aeromonas rivuli]|uniref:galactose-1-epimerase n=1 Tax=Aeromonas rivuli TaxID=648794 RepID=UPI0005AB6C69|nr:galactose-1-epimerase [Aeromonas rivuli]